MPNLESPFVEFNYRDPAKMRQLFSHFADEEWALLLDSGKTIHQAAKFDLILLRPKASIQFYHNKTIVAGIEIAISHRPFEDLKRFYQAGLKDAIALPEQLAELPFHGGIAGFASYDLGRAIEDLPQIAKHDIDLPEMAFGLYQWGFISDHQHQKSYLLKFSAIDDSSWSAISQEFQKLEQQDLREQNLGEQDIEQQTDNSSQYPTFALSSAWQSNMDEQEYLDKFQKVHDYIHAGDCYQVNLAQRFQASFSGHPWNAYLQLTEHNQAPFSAYMNLGKQQILSLSPERFIQIEKIDGKSHVVTQPIKGTRPRSKDPLEDKQLSDELLSSEKDRAENLMIVDLLRNDIGRTAEYGSVDVTKLFELQSFISVHHLVSTIEADLADGKDGLDLLEHCFPGGSITGAPKIRAMEIIEELEPHRRSIYCGSVLYYDFRGFLDSSITIRTLVAESSSPNSAEGSLFAEGSLHAEASLFAEGSIYAWGGGGLVADSEAASEYQETYHKLSRILPVLSAEKNSNHDQS
ncbi:aminodeoxychorismate synthase component I [Kangiella sp. TOML190]|uniref:aminodeoxychorismate synthase component I n=1 Tax=Kangiella sp. TOML190 TaxID=2931351 RepID=UPI0020424614|nr:aminodeoxychorismate synthase component I [Kangiella sp. TOML190]